MKRAVPPPFYYKGQTELPATPPCTVPAFMSPAERRSRAGPGTGKGCLFMSMTEKLDVLEAKIRRLKQEYEQYFLHILKREPIALKKEVQGLILRYTNMTINNTADQFRLNCLLSRFNSYRQYWVRTLRAMEDGTYVRHAESGPFVSPLPAAADSVPPAHASRGGRGPAVRGKNPAEAQRGEDLASLYNDYVEARRRNRAGVKGLSMEKFAASIKRARQRIEKTYDVRDIEVQVLEKDGQVKLVIRPSGVKVS